MSWNVASIAWRWASPSASQAAQQLRRAGAPAARQCRDRRRRRGRGNSGPAAGSASAGRSRGWRSGAPSTNRQSPDSLRSARGKARRRLLRYAPALLVTRAFRSPSSSRLSHTSSPTAKLVSGVSAIARFEGWQRCNPSSRSRDGAAHSCTAMVNDALRPASQDPSCHDKSVAPITSSGRFSD